MNSLFDELPNRALEIFRQAEYVCRNLSAGYELTPLLCKNGKRCFKARQIVRETYFSN